MNMDLKDLLNTLLSETNINKLNICQDKIEIYVDGPMKFTQETPVIRVKKNRYDLGHEGALRRARAVVKDHRWIKIMDELGLTPKEWIEKEYPDLDPKALYNVMRRYKQWSLRQCVNYCLES